MYFKFLIEISYDVKSIDFLYEKIEKPLKAILQVKEHHLKEYCFNFRILSKKFQGFYKDECYINKKAKRFIYSFEIDSLYFNNLSEKDALKILCTEIQKSILFYNNIKPKSYQKEDGFENDIFSIIEEYLHTT